MKAILSIFKRVNFQISFNMMQMDTFHNRLIFALKTSKSVAFFRKRLIAHKIEFKPWKYSYSNLGEIRAEKVLRKYTDAIDKLVLLYEFNLSKIVRQQFSEN